MSFLSGYDSESVGFESVSERKNAETDSGSQTTLFAESGAGSQTNFSKDIGCNTSPVKETQKPAVTPGLNEFLRRVVPSVLAQLDQGQDAQFSSDSEEENLVAAKVFQEINIFKDCGTGDHGIGSILGLTWSNSGTSLAVCLGKTHHENWCEHEGQIRIFTQKRSEGDKFIHNLDITETNCINIVKFHPKLSGLLSYGTINGDIVVCNLQNTNAKNFENSSALTTSGHNSYKVTCIMWGAPDLANMFILKHILKTNRRRNASDQVLISSGSDGFINVWLVNTSLKIIQQILSYNIDADITAFDFKMNGVFVAGTSTGKVFLCKTDVDKASDTKNDVIDQVFEGHQTSILNLAFSSARADIFASLSIDSELRIYDIKQLSPLKVICIVNPVTCMAWVPNNPSMIIVGLAKVAKGADLVQVYNIGTGRCVAMDGLASEMDEVVVTSIDVQSGQCRVAIGDTNSTVRVLDLPLRRTKYSYEDFEF